MSFKYINSYVSGILQNKRLKKPKEGDDTMQNKALIRLLGQLNPDDEVCVEIYECITKQFVDSTYDIGFNKNEYGQLVLQIDVEKEKFDAIN